MKKFLLVIGLVTAGMLMTASVARADHWSRRGCGNSGPTIVRHGNHYDIYGAGHHGGYGGHHTYHSGFYSTNPFGGGFYNSGNSGYYGPPSYNSGFGYGGYGSGFSTNRGGIYIRF